MISVINRDNTVEDLEKAQKEEDYLDYIHEHVNNVILMYEQYFFPYLSDDNLIIDNEYFNTDDFKNAISELKDHIVEHDNSKYSEEEFNAYRRHFFPTNTEKTDENQETALDEFEAAWEHHKRNNPHHPQYWVNPETGVPEDMSLGAIIEMLCDWMAMSKKFNDNTIDWYENKADKEKKAMTDQTKAIVEYFLYKLLNGKTF